MIPESLEFKPEVLYINKDFPLYSLHEAKYRGKPTYFKAFVQEEVEKSQLLETMEFNEEVFMNSEDHPFPDHICKIFAVKPTDRGVGIVQERFEIKNRLHNNLQQFRYKKQDEKKIFDTFEQIYKGWYSVYAAGYYSRNLRPEHFVKAKKTWKIESLVFCELPKKYQSQYIASKDHLPPQYSEKQRQQPRTEEQLEERMVWDLGCIFLCMILGNKNIKSNLQKISKEDFTEKIGLSEPTQKVKNLFKYLKKMCHPKMRQRMKLKQLLASQFFSVQVAKHAKNNLKSRVGKLFFSGKSAISSCLSKQSGQSGQEIIKMPLKMILEVDEEKFLKIHEEIQIQKQEERKNYRSIPQLRHEIIHEIYNCEKDKCEFLLLPETTYDQIKKLFKHQKVGQQTVLVAKYLLNFISAMMMAELEKKSKLFERMMDYGIDLLIFQEYEDTVAFEKMQQMIKKKRNQIEEYLKKLKKQLYEIPEPRVIISRSYVQHILNFYQPSKTQFYEIKEYYRRFLYQDVYGPVVRKYVETNERLWGQISFILTYCLTIDKMFIPQKMAENHQEYFQWRMQEPKKFISFEQFHMFIRKEKMQILGNYSRRLIETYYSYSSNKQ